MTHSTSEDISPDQTLAEIVEANPRRSRVLEGYGLDYCCGGAQALADACDEHELDPKAIANELRDVDERAEDSELDWDNPAELVEIIVDEHHDYLRDELNPLAELLETVVEAHVDVHPELENVQSTFEELKREIPVHLSEEEQLVFPAVRNWVETGELDPNQRAILDEVLGGLDDDHLETAEHLEDLRELTDDYAAPDDACPKYRAMLERLEALERDLHMHIHRENNLLFPAIEEQLA